MQQHEYQHTKIFKSKEHNYFQTNVNLSPPFSTIKLVKSSVTLLKDLVKLGFSKDKCWTNSSTVDQIV